MEPDSGSANRGLVRGSARGQLRALLKIDVSCALSFVREGRSLDLWNFLTLQRHCQINGPRGIIPPLTGNRSVRLHRKRPRMKGLLGRVLPRQRMSQSQRMNLYPVPNLRPRRRLSLNQHQVIRTKSVELTKSWRSNLRRRWLRVEIRVQKKGSHRQTLRPATTES